jgi:NAD(P) transhydrogenase subunit alpha
MRVAVPRETVWGEARVALVPGAVSKLVRSGLEVLVEKGAGDGSSFADGDYQAAGAAIVEGRADLLGGADVALKVAAPSVEEAALLKEGSVLVSFLQAQERLDLVRRLGERRVTSFSMDLVPRIARAQSMDALSSMGTLAGYKAVLVGAAAHGRILPMLVTAAGTIAPAKAFVLGAGVAGLQAIATLRRLGAVVTAFDVRPAVKEQVESLGARFIASGLQEDAEDKGGYARELSAAAEERNRRAIHEHLRDVDLVITTALIPGKPAPRLITEDMLADMKPGAVIVDLAAERGGNCAVTLADEEVRHGRVKVLGPTNLPSTVPVHASEMYARNLAAFLALIIHEGTVRLDFADPIISAMCVTHGGEVRHAPTRALLDGGAGAEELHQEGSAS